MQQSAPTVLSSHSVLAWERIAFVVQEWKVFNVYG